MSESFSPIVFQPIGRVLSCFGQKFGIPRQPGLAPDSTARLEILPPFDRPEAFAGLEAFSHLWVVFQFHASVSENECSTWNATVRPPRLGGNERVGVFASRSNFRPNPIGLSVVRLDRMEASAAGVTLHLSDHDLLDGTPVLDVKPYLPWADSLPHASGGFAPSAPVRLPVDFSPAALAGLDRFDPSGHLRLRGLIVQVLSLDPRPAYHAESAVGDRVYGQRLHGCDVRFRVFEGRVEVLELAD